MACRGGCCASCPCLASCPPMTSPCPLPCVCPSNPICPPRTCSSCCCGPCAPPSCCTDNPCCFNPPVQYKCNPCCGKSCTCCCPPKCGVFRPCCPKCHTGCRNCCTCAANTTRQIPSNYMMPFCRPASLHSPECRNRVRKILSKPCISIFNRPCKDCPPMPVKIALTGVDKWKEAPSRNFCCVPGVPNDTINGHLPYQGCTCY